MVHKDPEFEALKKVKQLKVPYKKEVATAAAVFLKRGTVAVFFARRGNAQRIAISACCLSTRYAVRNTKMILSEDESLLFIAASKTGCAQVYGGKT